MGGKTLPGKIKYYICSHSHEMKQRSVNYELSLLTTCPQKACLYKKQIIESNWDVIVNKIFETHVMILRLKPTVP
jgi:hypothetical protein